MIDETTDKLNQIVDALTSAKSKETIHFICNAIGSYVPFVSAAVAQHTEADQTKLNEIIYSVLKGHDDSIKTLWDALFDTRPTRAQLTMLFEEVTGLPFPSNPQPGQCVYIVLNPLSVLAFDVYKRLGWMEAIPYGHSTMQLGTGCSIGGQFIEDKKYAFGFGYSFVLVFKEGFFTK